MTQVEHLASQLSLPGYPSPYVAPLVPLPSQLVAPLPGPFENQLWKAPNSPKSPKTSKFTAKSPSAPLDEDAEGVEDGPLLTRLKNLVRIRGFTHNIRVKGFREELFYATSVTDGGQSYWVIYSELLFLLLLLLLLLFLFFSFFSFLFFFFYFIFV